MTKKIVMLGLTAIAVAAIATPSFAAQKRHSSHQAQAPRDAYAMDYGYVDGWQNQNMPPFAAGLWRPGLCWKDVDRLRRIGYFEACKK
jgi:hypothetical protein